MELEETSAPLLAVDTGASAKRKAMNTWEGHAKCRGAHVVALFTTLMQPNRVTTALVVPRGGLIERLTWVCWKEEPPS